MPQDTLPLAAGQMVVSIPTQLAVDESLRLIEVSLDQSLLPRRSIGTALSWDEGRTGAYQSNAGSAAGT